MRRELHVERLLGTRVRDVNGEVVGRIEEVMAENADGDMIVTEFHIGPAALAERILGAVHQLPFFSMLPFQQHMRRVSWDDMDFSDPYHPRALRRKADLDRVSP